MSYGSPKAHRPRKRHSRLRPIPVALLALVLVAFTAWWIASRFHQPASSGDALNYGSALTNPSQSLAVMAAQSFSSAPSDDRQVVYPYSVVPGGVRSPEDLHQASLRDRVVSRHFSGFDFRRAKVVELQQAKLVYLSYRMGNKVFWTKKKVHLRKGEKLISDGVISARTRCANQVSATPQNAISAEEPPAEAFEDPFGGGGTARQIPFPGNFESALFNRELAGFDPQGPGLPLFGAGSGQGLPPIFPPPLPSNECDPNKEICSPGPPPPPPPPPTPVPEPGTILLISSGLAGIYFRYRKMS